MNFFILLAIALAPGAAIGLYIYLRDKHEREPIGLVVTSFFLGILSTLITLLISLPIDKIIPIKESSLTGQAIHAFLIVALIEEFSKFFFVRWVQYPNKNFNEPYDGIVYAVSVGLGFAGFENILYVFNSDDGITTGIMRMFTAVPAHATFAILMGYFIGKAKFEHGKSYYTWIGLAVATLFHGAYDYFWFISFVPGIWVGALARWGWASSFRAAPFASTKGLPFSKENKQNQIDLPHVRTEENSSGPIFLKVFYSCINGIILGILMAMKNVAVLLLFCSLSVGVRAQTVFAPMKEAVKAGSAKDLVRFLNSSVDINLEGNVNTYSKAQAEFVLRDFFKKPCTY